jgi:hypothetical protein
MNILKGNIMTEDLYDALMLITIRTIKWEMAFREFNNSTSKSFPAEYIFQAMCDNIISSAGDDDDLNKLMEIDSRILYKQYLKTLYEIEKEHFLIRLLHRENDVNDERLTFRVNSKDTIKDLTLKKNFKKLNF